MSPENCPIKHCSWKIRLVMCPYHWDLVPPHIKTVIYNLHIDLQTENKDESYDELSSQLADYEKRAIAYVNEVVGNVERNKTAT